MTITSLHIWWDMSGLARHDDLCLPSDVFDHYAKIQVPVGQFLPQDVAFSIPVLPGAALRRNCQLVDPDTRSGQHARNDAVYFELDYEYTKSTWKK